MKYFKRRALALLLSVCMVLTMMPSMVFAAETSEEPAGDPVAETPADEAMPAAELEEAEPEAEDEVAESESEPAAENEIQPIAAGESSKVMKMAGGPAPIANGMISGEQTGAQFLEAASDDGKITLTGDVELTSEVEITNKNYTVNLGTYHITEKEGNDISKLFVLKNGGGITFTGAEGCYVENKGDDEGNNGCVVYVDPDNKQNTGENSINVGEHVTLRSTSKTAGKGCGIVIWVGNFEEFKTRTNAVKIDISGTVQSGTAEKQYEDGWFAVYGWGNNTSFDMEVNLHNGAKLYADTAIYAPCKSKITIENGTHVEGWTSGIEVRRGSLNIKGGTIKANDTVSQITLNGGGPDATVGGVTVSGAAVTVNPPKGAQIDVTMEDGELIGNSGLVITDSLLYSKEDQDLNVGKHGEGVKVSITGGTVKGETASVVAVPYTSQKVPPDSSLETNLQKKDNGLTVSGGTFLADGEGDTSIAPYIEGNKNNDSSADTQSINSDGNIGERKSNFKDAYFMVKNGGMKYYADLDQAIENVGSDRTVYLNRSVTLTKKTTINKEIILKRVDVPEDENPFITAEGRVFEIAAGDGNLTLENIEIQSKDTEGDEDSNEAAIKVDGTLTVNNNTYITADDSAVYVAGNGKLYVYGGEIRSDLEIAVATNGSGTNNSAEINIYGGTIWGAGNACGIYAPKGKVTIEGDAYIRGGSGIVMRGGELVIQENPIIEAFSEGKVAVGDVPEKMPAAAVVVDENASYTGNSDTKNKVEISGGIFEAQGGNSTIVYTENETIPEFSDSNAVPTDKIQVTGGTFTSDGSPDFSVLTYASGKGITSEGEIESNVDELFLVDFGYIANKSEIEAAGNNFVSPNGIKYKAKEAKWGDATFYWCFNRPLTADEVKDDGLKVTFTCGEKTFTDTCKQVGQRYASSFLNPTQNDKGQDVMVGGDWSISSPEEEFTTGSYGTAEVDLPDSVVGDIEIIPATINEDGKANDVEIKIVEANKDEKTYTIDLAAKNLHQHANKNGDMGYWVGFAVVKPSSGNQVGFYYQYEGRGWQWSTLEKLNQTQKGVAFYFPNTDNTTVKLAWSDNQENNVDENGYVTTQSFNPGGDVYTFNVTFSGVEKYVAPTTPTTPSTPTTPPTVEVPTPANGTASVDKPNAIAGDTVKITPKANEGYEVDKVTVTDKNGNAVEVKDNGDGTYSFVMPADAAQPVTVSVTFKEGEGGEVTPPTADALVFSSASQEKAIKNRITTNADTSLKLKAADEGVNIGSLADWTVESDDESVVRVLEPSNKLRYMGAGTAHVTVTAKGDNDKVYSIVITINVKPGTPTFTLSHVSSKKARTFTVTTSTVRGATGFQVKYSLKKSLKSSKTKTYVCGKKLKRQTIKANKTKRTYYVRVRAYQTVDGERVYGAWSKLTKRIVSR